MSAASTLPAPEAYMLNSVLNLGVSEKDFFNAQIKDSAYKAFLTSTEIKPAHPAVYQCANHWPTCLNKVTAHAKAYCEQFAPDCFQSNSPVRCQTHIDMAAWVRPTFGSVLQQARWGTQKTGSWCPVKLSDVIPMMVGFIEPIPMRDESKRRYLMIRLDDALLTAMHVEVLLKGNVTEGSEWKWTVRQVGGRFDAEANRDITGQMDSASMVLTLAQGAATITVQLRRAIDVLYTLRLGF